MSSPRITFITALHNCVELTEAMIHSLEQTVDLEGHEVILVDDASTDSTPELLRKLEDRFKILRNDTNRGFAFSNNRAAKEAQGQVLALLNNDLVLQPNWLEPMLEVFQTKEKVGVVGNVQRDAKKGWVDHAGIFFDLDGMPTHAWKTRKNPPSSPISERSAVTAACMLIDRSLFLEYGGFDEAYQNGMEDVDLCVRLKRDGYRHYVANRSVVLHYVSSSPNRHRNNEPNTERFRKQCADLAKPFGEKEWPREYLSRYKRYWWKMEPRKAAKAFFLLSKGNG